MTHLHGLTNTSQLLSRNFIYAVFFIIFLQGCHKDSSLGMSETETSTMLLDTFSVSSSTILLDSLPTGTKGIILVGNIDDPELGKLSSSSYFKVNTPGSLILPESSKFDSLSLVLHYSGYSYGDTTVAQIFTANQLTESLAYKTTPGFIDQEEQPVFSSGNTFYNVSRFNYDATPLATLKYYPKPRSKDSLSIALPKELGSTLFNLLKNRGKEIASQEDFEAYFKGIALSPSSSGNAVIGFKDTASVTLHYNYINTSGLKEKATITFPITNSAYQFNRIIADRSSTKLSTYTQTNREISSQVTDHKTYIQGGIGLVTKLKFPGLAYLVANQSTLINKAELIVESPERSDKPYKMPRELVLLLADERNKPISLYTDAYSGTSSARLNMADDIDQTSYYKFVITDYVNNYVKKYNQHSLLLSLPVASMLNSVDRISIGSEDNSKAKIKLRITYTKLQ